MNTSDRYIVGIGASAGGLEAIDLFFSRMPADSGMSFIVIQHLSPDYKSLMVELLSKKTLMPVHRAEDGMLVEKNTIYLIPPKKNLTISDSRLFLKEQDRFQGGISLPIDLFLQSLAEDAGEKAIAVILSGTGSDGMRGSRMVKEAGGMIMVQTEESAKFDGMPRAAISTGLVDFILPPEEMPAQLQSFIKYPHSSKAESSDILLSDEDGLTRIFSVLRERHKVDFTYYKPSTVIRRIERRMKVNQLESVEEYVRYLSLYPKEISQLYREILIGVTSFFRDADAFRLLEERFLPELLKDIGEEGKRFWVAGCSTGEEAYSMAILTCECMEKLGVSGRVKIFATDIDHDAILRAGTGIYPESIAADMSPHLISKYFYHKDNNLHINRDVREMVVFAKHNLIKDPPFTNIDFVSCRNLLIYLQPVLQKRAMEMFNFALNPGATLFLGSSETIGNMASFFEPLHNKWKIYRSRGKRDASEIYKSRPFDTALPGSDRAISSGTPLFVERQREERLQERLLKTLASHYVPLLLVVNEEFELLHVVGNSTGFITVPSGKISSNIKKMIVSDMEVPLSTGVQKAFRNKREVKFTNIRVNRGDDTLLVSMRITPMVQKRGQEPLVVISIEEKPRSTQRKEVSDESVTTYDIDKETQQRISDLELELQFSRENLQATVEELETSNEELQATNEELLASNEELQSTNEELQSVNEELFTVNAEHQQKITELTELNNDMENLLESTNLATLFLDDKLCIRKFTPQIKKFFKVLDGDIGRPLSHISHNIDETDLISTLKEVQLREETTERRVYLKGERWYMMRIVPYRIAPELFAGIVIVFVNLNRMHDFLKEAAWHTLIDRQVDDVVYLLDNSGVIIHWNPAAERLYGYSRDEAVGMSLDALLPEGNTCEMFLADCRDNLQQGSSYSGETRRRGKYNQPLQLWTKVAEITLKEVENSLWVVIERNLAQRESYEKDLVLASEFWEASFDVLPEAIAVLDKEYTIVNINQAMADKVKLSKEQCIGRKCYELIHDGGMPPHFCPYSKLLEGGEAQRAVVNQPSLGGEVEISVTPLRNSQGICGSVHIIKEVDN